MARVPQYQREVTPQLTPIPYREARLNEDMFGTNVSISRIRAGNAISNIGRALAEIQTRIEDTKILGLANYSSQWEQENLHNTEKGYYYKTGKDAYGQSEGLLKDYDNSMQEYISKAGFTTPSARKKANETAIALRNRIAQGVTTHDYKQGVVWANTEADTGKTNYINTAVNMRNSPDEISKALISGYQIIEWQGEFQHQDEATIRAEKMQYRSNLHQAVLSSLLGEGSLKAGEYLEEHKSEISPDKLPQYISAVKNNELNYTARNTALSLLNLPLDNAYAAINSIKDPQTRDTTMREYNTLTAQQDAIQKAKNEQFMSDLSDQLADALAQGSDANKLKQDLLKSDLPFDAKQKQISYINDCLELNQQVHLWNETEYLEELKYTDFEAFQKEDLSKYALTKSERQKYLNEQRQLVEYSTEAQLREIVKEFDTFFMPGKNSLNSSVYKDELVGLLARIEKLQGKAFNINDIDKGSLSALIEGFGYKSDTVANKNIDETKELYMRGKAVAEVKDRVARSYVNFKARNKKEPEPEEMFLMVQQIYNDVGRENKARVQQSVNRREQVYNGINSAQIKKPGYTKVLTYFEETTIPNLEKDTGVKMNITSTYRPTGKYGHEKGLKVDVFPQVATKENVLKAAEYLIASPEVEIIFTSNPDVLYRYGTNKKVHDARQYDNSDEAKKGNINHITHFDITLSKEFGGIEQKIAAK